MPVGAWETAAAKGRLKSAGRNMPERRDGPESHDEKAKGHHRTRACRCQAGMGARPVLF